MCYWDWNLKYLSLPMSNLAACCKPSSHHKLWQAVGSFAVNFCFRVWTFWRWFLSMALIKWLVCILQVHRTGSALSMAGIGMCILILFWFESLFCCRRWDWILSIMCRSIFDSCRDKSCKSRTSNHVCTMTPYCHWQSWDQTFMCTACWKLLTLRLWYGFSD